MLTTIYGFKSIAEGGVTLRISRAPAERGAGPVPFGSERYLEKDGAPIIVFRQVILTGENLTDAQAGFDGQNSSEQQAVRDGWAAVGLPVGEAGAYFVGAGGMLGADIVAKALPNGYTMLMANLGPNAINLPS